MAPHLLLNKIDCGNAYPPPESGRSPGCAAGVLTQDPYDVSLSNSIFNCTTTAVRRTGALSSRSSYNCFWECGTNLIGYPSSYGRPLLTNRNGHACDVAFNIFEDPGFTDTSSMKIAADSA